MEYSLRGDFDPQVGRPQAAFSIPKYSAELGLDPQADFANQPESQRLLGSAVLRHPSGASRVLDQYTP